MLNCYLMIFSKQMQTYLLTSSSVIERQDWRLRRDGDGGVRLVPVLDDNAELVCWIVLGHFSQAWWEVFRGASFRECGILLCIVS